MPLIPALLGRQRQMGLCEFEVNLFKKQVPGQTGLHRETLSQRKRKKRKEGTL